MCASGGGLACGGGRGRRTCLLQHVLLMHLSMRAAAAAAVGPHLIAFSAQAGRATLWYYAFVTLLW